MSFRQPSSDHIASRWTSVARVPGILFATAALVIALSGAVALPQLAAWTGPAPTESAPVHDEAAPTPAPTAHDTGDRLTAEEIEAFQAYVAWLQAQGLHKGHARYVHA